jgi:hypothetical protein
MITKSLIEYVIQRKDTRPESLISMRAWRDLTSRPDAVEAVEDLKRWKEHFANQKEDFWNFQIVLRQTVVTEVILNLS